MAGYPLTDGDRFKEFMDSRLDKGTTTNGFEYADISNEFFEVEGTRIFLHPVNTHNLKDFLEAIGEGKAAFGLIGHGLTERHILTAYKGEGNQITLYDSKRSDGERFLERTINPPFSIAAFFRTLFGFGDRFIIGEGINAIHAHYVSLGTQSAWDGATCGLHVAAMLNAIGRLCSEDRDVNADNVLDAMGNPVVDIVSTLDNDHDIHEAIAFSTYMKRAWNDTFLRHQDPNMPASAYFFGWHGSEHTLPYEPVVETLRSTLKLLTALPARVLAETGAFVRKGLMETAPKNTFTQSLRSGAMLLTFAFEGLCRGVGMLFQTALEPGRVIRSFIEGRSQQAGITEGSSPYGESHLQGSEGRRSADTDDDDYQFTHVDGTDNRFAGTPRGSVSHTDETDEDDFESVPKM